MNLLSEVTRLERKSSVDLSSRLKHRPSGTRFKGNLKAETEAFNTEGSG